MRRGQICWADLSEPGYRRPVVIIQADELNVSRLNTVMVAIITSNLRRANLPGNVLLPKRASGLPHDSVVNVTQLETVDKQFMEEPIGELSGLLMQQLDEGLRLALSL